jgi:hypothetical protein
MALPIACGAASIACTGSALPAPVTPWAGGAAWDAVHQLLWITNGSHLIALRPGSAGACTAACAPFLVPGMGGGYVATGLAYAERTQRLWVLASPGAAGSGPPVILQLPQHPTNPCQLLSTQCAALTLPNSEPTGGLALSERNQLVLFAQSSFTGAPNTVVWAAPWTAPCAPVCSVPLGPCGTTLLGPVTGLAYDDCSDTLYATDGRIIANVPFLQPPCLTGLATRCCQTGTAESWYGLDLEPSHAVVRGSACLTAPCPACNQLRLEAIGDPTLGNPAFVLRVAAAPDGALVFPLLGRGPATAGVPALCGLFHLLLPPAPLVLPQVATSGMQCSAGATVPLPIPPDLALCGANLCTQAVVVCLQGLGTGLTNALDLTVSDH